MGDITIRTKEGEPIRTIKHHAEDMDPPIAPYHIPLIPEAIRKERDQGRKRAFKYEVYSDRKAPQMLLWHKPEEALVSVAEIISRREEKDRFGRIVVGVNIPKPLVGNICIPNGRTQNLSVKGLDYIIEHQP